MTTTSKFGYSIDSTDRIVSISMSGGSLYAAICRETNGWNAGSGSAMGRGHRTRQVASRLSKAKEPARLSATSSSANRTAEATVATTDSPEKKVTDSANARYTRAEAM